MKKIFSLGLALLAVMAVVSCSSGSKKQTKPLTPEEQQDKLETTAKTLVDEIDVDNWKGSFDFSQDFANYFGKMTDKNPKALDAFGDWADEMEDAFVVERNGETRTVVALSALKGGVFEEKDGVFVYTEGKKSELGIIIYPDGVKSEAHFYFGPDSNQEYAVSFGTKASSKNEVYVKVPTWIEQQMIQGGKTRLSYRMNLSVYDKNKDGVLDMEHDQISASGKVTVDDFVLSIDKFYFDNGSAASISFVLTHGSKKIIGFTASASGDGMDMDEVKTLQVDADFLGQVQIRGNMDTEKMEYYADECDANYKDGDAFKASLAKLNSTFSLAVYYDGGSNRQAWLAFEAFVDDDGEWYADPVFQFQDGTTQAIEEFMDNEHISQLFKDLSDWFKRVEKYFKD